MNWLVSFFVAIAIFILGCIWAIYLARPGKRKNKIVTAFNVLLCGVFLSALVIYFPVCNAIFEGENLQVGKAVFMTIFYAIRLFIAEGEFGIITDHIHPSAGWLYTAYTGYAIILLVLAPCLTFGIVLSFFKNVSAWRKYIFSYVKDVYIFSEMNEKSLTLAESIYNNDNKRRIVFMNAPDSEEESAETLIERAQTIDAVCFKNDILAANLMVHSKRKTMNFFAIGENENQNLENALKLVERYRNVPNTHLYVFTTGVEGELLLTSLEKGSMKVRRVNEVRSLVNRLLYENGKQIFDGTVPGENGVKQIGAVIVGSGNYGSTMMKALSWFGQMEDYELTIDVFDRDPMIYDKLYVQCPELISEQYNGVVIPGEAQYQIRIHGDMDIDSKLFAEEILKLNNATYVFVALGSDEENIRATVYLRMLFERNGIKPVIQAIVHNTDKAKALEKITNYRGQAYAINFIGDLETSYSEEVILDSDLEKEALSRHLKWGNEDDFWKYEYNYSSSIASAIHMKVREELGVLSAGKQECDLTEEERDFIEKLEHRRWNAYMRSQGYVYSGSSDASSRNDLGKMHHDLVEFNLLSEEEKRKDSRVGSK